MIQNPIHKRLEKLATWQQVAFMLCLCERMYPNFYLFCDITHQPQAAKRYFNILNLIWEFLTVKNAKINFERQLEKLEEIIPDINDCDYYGVFPAVDACEGLSNLLHALIAGAGLEQAIKMSQLSLKTIVHLIETQTGEGLSQTDIKHCLEIQQELDLQWEVYRSLKSVDKHDVNLLLDWKVSLRNNQISNIGIEI